MILTVGNTKGGSGKSTLASNLAILHALQGQRVLLVDGDEQTSSLDFCELRAQNGKHDLTAIALHGNSVRTQVRQLALNYDQIIIDVGGRNTASMRAALTITHRLLVPVQPRTFDLWAIEQVVTLIKEAREVNEHLCAFSVLNLADPQGRENAEAAQLLQEFAPMLVYLDAPLTRRKVYADAISQGKGILEYLPKNTKAIAELKKLAACIYS